MKMPKQAMSMKRPSWDITLGELREIGAIGVADKYLRILENNCMILMQLMLQINI